MKNSKKGVNKQDLIELLSPAIKDYFQKELKHPELTPVQMDSKSSFAGGRKSEQFPGLKYSKRQSWIVNIVNILNESIPSFNDIFDKETFYKFVFIVIIASILFVLLMVKVFKVRIREYPMNIPDGEWRDWRPANPFRFPWQGQPNSERRRHQKND